MREIIDFIRSTVLKWGYLGAVIGISGGIDSAVVGKLAVDALGKKNVFGLLMPERDSSKDTLEDSKLVARFLGIDFKVKNISSVLRAVGCYRLQPPALLIPQSVKERYVRDKWQQLSSDPFLDDLADRGSEEFKRGLAFYRAKHRVRMVSLYLEAEKRGYAVLGTTNKTEWLCGLYVKWGDDSSDIEPIKHLLKTEVMDLARDLRIPSRIIEKPPSPDLIPGVNDETAFGLQLNELDEVLREIEAGKAPNPHDRKVMRVMEILQAVEHRKLRNISIIQKK
ncbi:MAG: NAD(+) synthase [Kosmotogaceae bacterium]|nr:NAD(+) synthase [Kosmotogaceae bacterium]